MRALVTGIEGFSGSHLAEHLLAAGDEVWGTLRPGAATANLEGFADRLELREADVTVPGALAAVFKEARPEVVYHLAGLTTVYIGRAGPAAGWAVNFGGTQNAIAAAMALAEAGGSPPRLVYASSMKVYPPRPEGGNLSETDPVGPDSVYGATKVAAEHALLAAGRHQGLPVVILRLFFQLGPRQAPDFAVARQAEQIARLEAGRAEAVVKAGRPGVGRDYTDVRDIARAFRLAAVKGAPGAIYNVASGRVLRLREIMEQFQKQAKKPFAWDPPLDSFPPEEPAAVTGGSARFREATGWAPAIAPAETVAAILEHHRRLVAAPG